MYLRILIIFIGILSNNNLFSQINAYVHIGIGSATLVEITANDKIFLTPIVVYSGGVNFEKKIKSKHSIMVGLNYSEKGGLPNKGFLSVIDGEYKRFYIDIPIIYSYQLHKKIKPFIGINNCIFVDSDINVANGDPTKFTLDLRAGFNIGIVKNIELNLIYDYSLSPTVKYSNNFYSHRLLFGVSCKL